MSIPKVSVIIPFRDVIKNIERAVQSILNQTFSDFELILVNDGSTDGSREYLRKVQDDRIVMIDLAASGTVVALNEAIYSTRSEFIALLDPYDVARKDRIEEQFRILLKNPETDVVSSCVKYIPESSERNIRSYIDWTNGLLSHEDIYQKRFINATVLHSTLMFRKKLIPAFGLFGDGEFPEDYEMLLRWMQHAVRFVKSDEELTEWHDDLQRLSRRHLKYNSSAASKIRSRFFNQWFKDYFANPPDILLWGAKKLHIDKIRELESEGLRIAGYVNEDGQDNPWLADKPVFSMKEIPSRVFIIFLAQQFDPGEVPGILKEKGMEEGINFIGMS